ncbi:MAG: heme ABC exporter ATP-binding protein CcmA [Luteococcus sp.]|uniref:heme ABC exporter ATP-binding protein CcmA n=1 Tax=Luteococcus sp. TaxID=1969402 RepID=UPI0026492D11|nr:heme ABC exporter ATP-binding protein CcmA [Luteococcus sp.]MDN5563570.1 heme ABC exporter ATP-binding protein CcmA [Luteococcus sp.]
MIDVNDVSMKFPRALKPVFEEVTFTVGEGAIAPLIGSNGAGKTTLLRIIAGIISPATGSVSIKGADPTLELGVAQRDIGLSLYPERSFYFRLTSRQNLEYFASLRGLFGKQARAEADRTLCMVGLEEKADAMFMRMSLGQRRRLGLARALLCSPGVLLLDEPTANLDSTGSALVQGIIREHAAAGGAVMLSTHHQQDLRLATGPVLTLKGGQLTEVQSAASTLSRQVDITFGSGDTSVVWSLAEKYPLTRTSDGVLLDVPLDVPLAAVISELSSLGVCISSVIDGLWSMTTDSLTDEVSPVPTSAGDLVGAQEMGRA